MKITFRQKVLLEINNLDDFEIYLKKNIAKFNKLNNATSAYFNKIKNEIEVITQTDFNTKLRNDLFNFQSPWAKDFWLIRGYTENEATNNISIAQKENANKNANKTRGHKKSPNKDPMKIEYWLEKFNDPIIAKQKFDKCLNKCKSTLSNTTAYWTNKGYSEEDAKLEIQKIQTKRSKIGSDKRKENPEKYKDVTWTQAGYWVKKGFSEEEAKSKVSERQAVGRLDRFIERYGKDEGTKRWEERQIKWQKSMWSNPDGIPTGRSKICNDFIDNIFQKIPDIKEECMFGTNEKYIKTKSHEIYKYDLCYKKLIIEFNGDYWHCNPEKYTEDQKISYPGLDENTTVKDIWERDNKKVEAAKSYGYEVFIIWENDYRKNQEAVINRAIQKINSYR